MAGDAVLVVAIASTTRVARAIQRPRICGATRAAWPMAAARRRLGDACAVRGADERPRPSTRDQRRDSVSRSTRTAHFGAAAADPRCPRRLWSHRDFRRVLGRLFLLALERTAGNRPGTLAAVVPVSAH